MVGSGTSRAPWWLDRGGAPQRSDDFADQIAPQAGGELETMKIFMVDDDKEAVEWVIEALEEYGGHKVTKVSTATEAEAAFAAGKWDYELLIIDVQLKPRCDEKTTEEESFTAGLTLLKKFRARLPNDRVLILTNNIFRV